MSLAAAASSLALGCQPPEEGVWISAVLRGSHETSAPYGSNVLVRAVPDHRDGFLPSREYHGTHSYEDWCPLEHVEFPLEFELYGSDRNLHGTPSRWLLLAWITDDTDAVWVAPGELYGTATFDYEHDDYFGYWADGIVVTLDRVRP